MPLRILRAVLSFQLFALNENSPVAVQPKKSATGTDCPPNTPRWRVVEYSQLGYREAWQLQQELVVAVKAGHIKSGVVLALEHPPVFTMGRRGGRENLCVSEVFLKQAGIDLIQIERGGDITFHGPGQLVVYPIIALTAAKIGVVDFVTALEEVMIRTAAQWGVTAQRNPVNRGVWVGPKKLGSIGIAVRRGVSFHGLAFNVTTDLTPFQWVNPCGLKNVAMTTLERESAQNVTQTLTVAAVRQALIRHLAAVFRVQLITEAPETLKTLIEGAQTEDAQIEAPQIEDAQ